MSEEENPVIRMQRTATRLTSKKMEGVTGKWRNNFASATHLSPNRQISDELSSQPCDSKVVRFSALLPLSSLRPPLVRTAGEWSQRESRRSGKNSPFRSESLRENQKTGEWIHEMKIFKFTSLAISQNISTFACRLLSMWLICSHARVLIAGFHWPKHGG